MNTEKIKKALDSFEDDNFVDTEEILTQQIRLKKNEYLKKELGLEKDVVPVEAEPEIDQDKDISNDADVSNND